MSSVEPVIACNLDALTPSERAWRSELAVNIQAHTAALEEFASGYRIQLPNDPALCEQALELILLERRCCPFLSLELAFEPGEGHVYLQMGGSPAVKQFLRKSGVLGCAEPTARSSVCG